MLGLALGMPGALMVRAAGYPNGGLYVWLGVLAAVYAGAIVVAASLAASDRGAMARGLVVGSTAGFLVAPMLVVLDIGLSSA